MKGLDNYITGNYGENQFTDYPCEVCGLSPDDCICPECPVCGEVGNPDCYGYHFDGNPMGMEGNHGLKETLEQRIGKEKARLHILEDQVYGQQMYIDWLECQRKEGD